MSDTLQKKYKEILVELIDEKLRIEEAIEVIQGLANGETESTETRMRSELQESRQAQKESNHMMAQAAETAAQKQIRISSKRFFGMKPRQAAEEFLRMKNEHQTAREISEALLKGGIETISKNFPNYMHQTIMVSIEEKRGVFVRSGAVKKSKFGLKEWAKK